VIKASAVNVAELYPAPVNLRAYVADALSSSQLYARFINNTGSQSTITKVEVSYIPT